MKSYKLNKGSENSEGDLNMNGSSALKSFMKLQVPGGKSKEHAWNEILQKIQSAEEETPVIKINRQRFSFIAIAASFLLIIGVSISILYYTTDMTISCPRGQQMSIHLPDQSTVILNSETKISYNKLLWKSKRTVFLQGEAFFNVQKGRRFDVKTHNAIVSVLGTSFNVFSRKGEVKVNCFTGKVAVKNRKKALKTVVLVPGKETIISFDGQPADPLSFDVAKAASWKGGEFYFDKAPIINVVEELERQYKVVIEFKGDTNRIYTGYFNNKNLSEALKMVCMPMNLKFNQDSNKIIISQ